MRIVIKIGTSTLTHSNGCMNVRRIENLVKIISDIKNAGNEVIMVSSGAIAMGVSKLNLPKKPKEIALKQACAAVGQCELMYVYDKLFLEYNHTVAQILLTAPDLQIEDRNKNFTNTMEELLSLKVLPIINENDTVEVEEIKVGDNDTLAALVANSIKADLLVLLSDIDGLYTKDPHKYSDAELIKEVFDIDDNILSLGGGAGSELGTGGMETKIKAASIVTKNGCDMIITNGNDPEKLYAIIDNKPCGTRFYSRKK